MVCLDFLHIREEKLHGDPNDMTRRMETGMVVPRWRIDLLDNSSPGGKWRQRVDGVIDQLAKMQNLALARLAHERYFEPAGLAVRWADSANVTGLPASLGIEDCSVCDERAVLWGNVFG
jgi:hypothetical protein